MYIFIICTEKGYENILISLLNARKKECGNLVDEGERI